MVIIIEAFAAPQDRSTVETEPSGGADFALKRMANAVRFYRLYFIRFRENQSDKLRGAGQRPAKLSDPKPLKAALVKYQELPYYDTPILYGIIPLSANLAD